VWQIIPQSELQDQHWQIWQSLNDRYFCSHPLLDIKFLRPLVDCFSESNLHMVIQKENGVDRAAALIEKAGYANWQVFSPSQLSIAPLIMDPISQPKFESHLNELAIALPGPVWIIAFLGLDPDVLDLQNYLDKKRYEKTTSSKTININVEGDFDSYWRSRRKKQRQNVNRHLKKMEQDGMTPSLKVIRDYAQIENAIISHGEMESAGWKGKEGTAIHKDNVQGKFYTRMLQNFAKSNGAYVCQLWVDDRAIASLLNICQEGMLVCLKTTYCESMARYSPGRLIDYFMLPVLFEDESIKIVEHYTNASRVDEKWATGSRKIYHLNYFTSLLAKHFIHFARPIRRAVTKSGKNSSYL
jgi:hypothetical protein